MLHRVLGIGHWVIDFLFAKDRYDEDGVLACLYEIDTPYEKMQRAVRIMESKRYNRGFTYANPELRRAVVVIGPTTSGKQFVNSFVHEVRHVADAIAESIGYNLGDEGPAYLSGDAAMELADVVCRLGCDHCREVK